MARDVLAAGQVHDEAAKAMATFQSAVVAEVRDAVAREKVVVVGMQGNPFVGKVRRALADAGIPFHYIGHGSYLGGWKKRLAIKLWSGWPTFPQVFVRGVLIGGYDDTKRLLDDGRLKQLVER